MVASSLDRIHVLYVATDETEAETFRTEIESTAPEIEVWTVTSTAAAFERLETEHVDCIVAPYDLPETDGVDFLNGLRDRGIRLPFVLFPDESAEVASRAVAAGVDRYRPRSSIEESAEELAADVTDAVEEFTPDRELLDRMTDGFLALDDRFRITYFNEHAREIIAAATGTDRSLAQLRGESIWDAVPQFADTEFEEHCREAMARQDPLSFESAPNSLDARFEMRVFPSPTGLTIYCDDITDRREQEQTLEYREQILRDIYRIIADKDRDFRSKVEALLEVGRDELGMPYGTLSQIEGNEYTLSVVAGPEHELIAEGTTVSLDATNCERIVESERTLALADVAEDAPELTDRLVYELGIESYLGAPIFVEGDIEGTFCLFDVEPREEPFSKWELTLVDLMGSWISYEREREHQQAELERERNRLDAVASTLSHDLRNPLTTANLRLELATEECDSEHLDDVGTALDRIDELIENTLSMARLGADVLEPKPLQFETLVRQAWQTASATDGRLEIVDDSGQIVADESTLQQLFENLFANAVEHGRPESGELVVRVGHLSDGDGFYVADNGPGVPEEDHDEIFDRGFSTRSGGTGFGLSIVERIVGAHDGEISVTESEHGGARFEIRGLPIRT